MKTFSVITLCFVLACSLFSEEPADKNYEKLVAKLFEGLKKIEITGWFAWKGKAHEIKFKSNDEKDLRMLEEAFRNEKPRFSGIIDPNNTPVSMYASNLVITWFEKGEKELGHIALIDGDTVIFNGKQIYITKNLTLLIRCVDIALPELFDAKKKQRE